MTNLRITRRRLLVSAGAGVLGLTVLNTLTGCTTGPGRPAPGASDPGTPGASGPAAGGWQRVELSFVSAYLLVRGAEAAVVDLGVAGSAGAIGSALTAAGSSWDAVRHIVLTHKHGDHVGSLAEIDTPAGIHVGAADLAGISPARTLTPVEDGDEVFGLQIIGTPGHTAGHVAVFDPATGVLVAGDALRTTDGLTGPDPQYTADPVRAAASIRRLSALQVRTILPGHGAPLTNGAAEALTTLAASLKD